MVFGATSATKEDGLRDHEPIQENKQQCPTLETTIENISNAMNNIEIAFGKPLCSKLQLERSHPIQNNDDYLHCMLKTFEIRFHQLKSFIQETK